MATDTTAARATIAGYLSDLFGTADAGYIAVNHVQPGGPWLTIWKPVADLEGAAYESAKHSAAGANVYIGMGIYSEPQSGRGNADHVVGLPGLWHDLDCASNEPAHKKRIANRSRGAGAGTGLPLPATEIVRSGHGLYPLWLFHEVETITDHNRARYAGVSTAWQSLINAQGAKWDLDSTSDLARVLRPAGVMNWKINCTPVPVEIMQQGGPRYTLEELEECLPAIVTPSVRPVPGSWNRRAKTTVPTSTGYSTAAN